MHGPGTVTRLRVPILSRPVSGCIWEAGAAASRTATGGKAKDALSLPGSVCPPTGSRPLRSLRRFSRSDRVTPISASWPPRRCPDHDNMPEHHTARGSLLSRGAFPAATWHLDQVPTDTHTRHPEQSTCTHSSTPGSPIQGHSSPMLGPAPLLLLPSQVVMEPCPPARP